MENYYQNLLVSNAKVCNSTENGYIEKDSNKNDSSMDSVPVPEKWKGQIEKVFGNAAFSPCILSLLLFLSHYYHFKMCRIYHAHSRAILLWMRMEEMH